MKYYKCLVFIVLMMILGINSVNAQTCYYTNSDDRVLISYDTSSQKFTIAKRDIKKNLGTEPLINNKKNFNDRKTGLTVAAVNGANCPEYIVYRHNSNFIGSDGIFGFNDLSSASSFSLASNQIKTKINAWVLTPKNITQQEFENMKNDTSYYGKDITCEGIFGSKDDPASLRYMINDILTYPRIIVPALVIGFGILDFTKAVTSSKEEEMKKAQTTFIKRVLIGITIFFVPLIINIIMYLADIVWNGTFTTCGL